MGNPITLSLVVLMVVSWRSYRQVTRVVEEPQGCCNPSTKKAQSDSPLPLASERRASMLRGMFRLLQFAFPFLLTSVASGYEMTRRDRLGVLYSNQVVFDKRVSRCGVRITEGRKKSNLAQPNALC